MEFHNTGQFRAIDTGHYFHDDAWLLSVYLFEFAVHFSYERQSRFRSVQHFDLDIDLKISVWMLY